jgi:integrase
MPAQERFKTQYPGVHFIVSRPGTPKEDRVFYVDYRKDGKRYQEKAGFASKGMTAAKANNIRSDRMRGKEPSNKERREAEEATKKAETGRWTIDRIFTSYKENRRQGKALNEDVWRYEKYLKTPFGSKEPAEIAPLDVDRVRLRLLKKLSPQTVKHVLNLFTWITNYAKKKNLCPALNFHVQKPTVSNNKTEDLTGEQLINLMAAIDADPNIQVGNLMKMALFTGMRAGELFRLEWDHVDFARGFIRIVGRRAELTRPYR